MPPDGYEHRGCSTCSSPGPSQRLLLVDRLIGKRSTTHQHARKRAAHHRTDNQCHNLHTPCVGTKARDLQR